MARDRLLWADYVKGLTIVLVVYGHALVGVSKDTAIDPTLYAYIIRPFSQFRMPVFFFVSGLFAATTIRRERTVFVDRTILHLLYIFIVWNVVQFAFRFATNGIGNDRVAWTEILWFPLFPINVTWFIWALILFYVASRLCRDLPPGFLLAAATLLAATTLPADNYAVVMSAKFYVYFVLGLCCAERLLGGSVVVSPMRVASLTAAYWISVLTCIDLGIDEVPIVDIANSCLGIAWIVALCMVAADRGRLGGLAWLAGCALPIFVSHTLFTAATREILIRFGHVGNAALLVGSAWLIGVLAPIAMDIVLRRLGFPWLFRRPAWFALPGAVRRGPTAAERPDALRPDGGLVGAA